METIETEKGFLYLKKNNQFIFECKCGEYYEGQIEKDKRITFPQKVPLKLFFFSSGIII